jgi:uncharacterized circularly permuted ATP-grasp superfamily protein
MRIHWNSYPTGAAYDELVAADGMVRPHGQSLAQALSSLSLQDLRERQKAAESAIIEMGITFTVYSEGENIDRAWPYDIIPRMIDGGTWDRVDAGLRQRMLALNLFIADVYGDQRIIRDGVFPMELLANSANFRKECMGIKPPHGVWAHICGSDLIRDHEGRFLVLEDNLRVPSGVSYMMENRALTKRVFGEVLEDATIRPISDYPTELFDMLAAISPRTLDYPEIVVLTPGIYNSAYFEHSFLARHMGAELVEGADLVVGDDDCVYMRTIDGLQRVDVIYRRIDDQFLDSETFRKDSVLGVPGLMRAWRAGNVGLANAPGAGVADDKVVYAFVPEFIRYYLDQDPQLPNVDTFLCYRPDECAHVLANLEHLVVKPANESGGYGMLIGPAASKRERGEFARRIRENPRNYIAQPLISLSTVPTLIADGIAPRHVDLRPFILQSDRLYVTPGGLTRVAMREGSTVVNSSQGGGSKDTWVLE